MTERPRCVGVDRPHYRNDCPHPPVYIVTPTDATACRVNSYACRRHLTQAIGDAKRVTVYNYGRDPRKGTSDE